MKPDRARFDDPDLAAEALANGLTYLATEMIAHDRPAAGPALARLRVWLDANITGRGLSDGDCLRILSVVEKALSQAAQQGGKAG